MARCSTCKGLYGDPTAPCPHCSFRRKMLKAYRISLRHQPDGRQARIDEAAKLIFLSVFKDTRYGWDDAKRIAKGSYGAARELEQAREEFLKDED